MSLFRGNRAPMRRQLGGLAASATAMRAGAVQAQSFPSKPIRLIVPVAPGGATDALARMLAAGMGAALGQQVIVDNRSGASGVIGTNLVATSPADGYTLLFATTTYLGINLHTIPDLPYRLEQFAPVSLMATSSWVIAASPKLPVRDCADMVAYVRAHPGELNYATNGRGTGTHVFGEMAMSAMGTRAVDVAFRGEGLAFAALAAGDVQLLSTSISGVLVEQHRAGGLRILAIADERRSDYVPDVPTFRECGVPLVVDGVWFGVVAPAGTPPEALARLNAAVVRAVEAPDLRERILTGGATPRSTTSEQMGDIMRRDAETWGRAVRSLNVPLN